MPQTYLQRFPAVAALAPALECCAVQQRLPAEHDVGGQVPGTQLLDLQPVLNH